MGEEEKIPRWVRVYALGYPVFVGDRKILPPRFFPFAL
jgi:hypothetical protein